MVPDDPVDKRFCDERHKNISAEVQEVKAAVKDLADSIEPEKMAEGVATALMRELKDRGVKLTPGAVGVLLSVIGAIGAAIWAWVKTMGGK